MSPSPPLPLASYSRFGHRDFALRCRVCAGGAFCARRRGSHWRCGPTCRSAQGSLDAVKWKHAGRTAIVTPAACDQVGHSPISWLEHFGRPPPDPVPCSGSPCPGRRFRGLAKITWQDSFYLMSSVAATFIDGSLSNIMARGLAPLVRRPAPPWGGDFPVADLPRTRCCLTRTMSVARRKQM